MGLLAQRAHSVFIRQTLSGSDCKRWCRLIDSIDGLLDDSDLSPNPDYFTALIWKKLMGQSVLTVESDTSTVRAYVHSTKGQKGNITVALLNLDSNPITINFPFPSSPRTEYLLTSTSLSSREMMLNGSPLQIQV